MHFPEGFLNHLSGATGFNKPAFIQAHAESAPVSIRLNPHKSFPSQYSDPVPWCNDAYYLPERPSFVMDPLLHAGAYYVQEASSMFIDHLIRSVYLHDRPIRILDLCASPGGKSTLLASAIHPGSTLYSNEVIRNRVGTLRENLTKWGYPNVIITSNDAADFSSMRGFFDVIVVDAPCSGSGMFRKDPASTSEWSPEHVAHCSKRQQRIVEDILPALKNNGYLIYATCSYSTAEDEDIVQYCRDNHMHNILEPNISAIFPGIVIGKNGYRFYPDKIRGEGFFVSLMQKHYDDPQQGTFRSPAITPCNTDEKNIAASWIQDPDAYVLIKHHDQIIALPEHTFQALGSSGSLHIQQSGITIGEIKHGQFIPSHALALSTILSPNIPRHEVDHNTALQYLRKNTIAPTSEHNGWMLITFEHIPLGFVKSIPGRWNNYYPTEWRLRK